MKKVLAITSLLLLVFYYMYPQALSFFGFSFIFTSGMVGIALYIYNKCPYSEIVSILLAYLPMILLTITTAYVNEYYDPYLIDTGKSLIAWIFSAYLIIFLFFQIHPKGSVDILIYYIVGAILLQAIISVAMYMNPTIYQFFDSIHMIDYVTALKRAETKGERLLGYGIAFFGAGVVYGVALVLLAYIIAAKKLKTGELIVASFVYSFIFFVGLLSARTTLVGAGSSLILMFVLFFFDKQKKGKQLMIFLFLAIFLVSIGQTVCYFYFPDFADWAFEVFINYEESGELRTTSSDALSDMFYLPTEFKDWAIGNGHMLFWGTDVGYSRLLFYFGLPGAIAFFFFQFVFITFAFSKKYTINLTLIGLFVYNLALNIKGLSDLNQFTALFVFYFLYYKYFVYSPQIYSLEQQRKKLRHSRTS